MFTKYGYSTLGIIAICTFLFIVLSFFVNNFYLKSALIVIPVAFLLLSLNFFRDPDRTPPEADNVVVSPADGRVLLVKDVIDDKYINGKAIQISIFMSAFDVHVNRVPFDGTVEYLNYIEGEFVAAFKDKASLLNERYEIGIKGKYGKVFFTQVAGLLARRIVNELKEGQSVHKGERFGMIKFGSRVDVVVSYVWKPKVSKDDVVTAGETVLFEHPE